MRINEVINEASFLDKLQRKLGLNVLKTMDPIPVPSKGMDGTKGDDVKQLQTALDKLGFNVGTIDGIYGPRTAMAVRQFQRTYGLGVDGNAGRNTVSKVNDIISGTQSVKDPKSVGDTKLLSLIDKHSIPNMISSYANRYKIPTDVALAVAKKESNMNPNAIGDKHLANKAYGVMQVRKPAYLDGKKHFGFKWSWEEVQTNPQANIEAGLAYLAVGRDVYGYTSPADYLAFYNGGPRGPKKQQAQLYAQSVLKGAGRYPEQV